MSGRKSLLVALGAAVVAAGFGLASDDRGGRMLLSAGLPSLAAEVIRDPGWRGIALYRAGRYAEAAEAFRRSRDPSAAYNLGNALARAGDLVLAVKAYDIALRHNPDDTDARANRALASALLAEGASPDVPMARGGSANATARLENQGGDNTAGDELGLQSTSGDGMAGQREAGTASEAAGSSRVDRRGQAQSVSESQGDSVSRGAATDSAGRAGKGGGLTTSAETDESAPRPPGETEAVESAQATRQWLAAIPDDPVAFLKLRIGAEREKRRKAGTSVPEGGGSW